MRKTSYEDRVRKALDGDKNTTILSIEIDSLRSIEEIEKDLVSQQNRIPKT
jgi:hypothetical protein